ncbi:MAG: hypothetical protein KDJ52_29125 [Anaerolineae bacterium]|nr:hypothetical protein [Anaerolineae bacterium]
MKNILDRVKSWLEREGKVWLFRISIALAIFVTILADFNLFQISTNTLLTIMLGLLLLFGEIFLDETSRIRKTNQDGQLLPNSDLAPLIREETRNATDISLIVRSGESMYYTLRETVKERGSKLRIRIVFTSTWIHDEESLAYQKVWISRWEKLFKESATKYEYYVFHSVAELQGIIIDYQIGFLNYRTPDIESLWIRCSKEARYGTYLINMYETWINQHIANNEIRSLEQNGKVKI